MDTSSVDNTNTSDSGAGSDNEEEQIPMAVPVASIVAAKPAPAASNNEDVDESDNEEDDDGDDATTGEGGRDQSVLDTTFDTAGTGDGDEDIISHATDLTPPPPSSKKRSNSEISEPNNNTTQSSGEAAAPPATKKKKTSGEGGVRQRQPATKGLTIPFRTIKRIMKIDDSLGIVQNDAAIITTAALEHFVKTLAVKSLELAKSKGRNTIKYDDVAEVRAADRSLSFLDLLMP